MQYTGIQELNNTNTFLFLGDQYQSTWWGLWVRRGSSMDYFLSSLLFTKHPSPPLCVSQKNLAASIFHLCLCARFTYGHGPPCRSDFGPRQLFRLSSKPFLNPLVTTFVAGPAPNFEQLGQQTEDRWIAIQTAACIVYTQLLLLLLLTCPDGLQQTSFISSRHCFLT